MDGITEDPSYRILKGALLLKSLTENKKNHLQGKSQLILVHGVASPKHTFHTLEVDGVILVVFDNVVDLIRKDVRIRYLLLVP